MARTPTATRPTSNSVPLRSMNVFSWRREAGRRAVVRRELTGDVELDDDVNPDDDVEPDVAVEPDGAAEPDGAFELGAEDAGRERDRLATAGGISSCQDRSGNSVAAGGDGRAATHERLRHKPRSRPKAG
jgi:hypothetical protein